MKLLKLSADKLMMAVLSTELAQPRVSLPIKHLQVFGGPF